MINALLGKLAGGATLSEEESADAIGSMMRGEEDPVCVASFLTALRVRGETAAELTGAAKAMRAACLRPDCKRTGIADTCGTGGSPVSTFNVSTAAAIVTSACGVPVAKHGNRSFSSATGSADVLAALGVNIDASPTTVARCLDEIGLAFFFAPHWHPAMKHVAPVRRALGFRTLFNLVGPLANPAPLDVQLLGVGQEDLLFKMARALRGLGIRSAAVVWGEDGVDEVSLSASTRVMHVTDRSISPLKWTPADFGLDPIDPRDLSVSNPDQSAAMIRSVLRGDDGPAQAITLANVAATLWLAGKATTLREGVETARKAIELGSAQSQLDRLVEESTR